MSGVRASSLEDLDLSDGCEVHDPVQDENTFNESGQGGAPDPQQSEPDDEGLPLTIDIPGKPPSLNDFYSGMHWSERKRIRDDWHEKVAMIAPDATVDEYPVAVGVVCYWGEGRRYDAENLAVLSKLITDGLVEADVLEGDGPRQVRRVSLEARRMDADGHLTRYTITEAQTHGQS